MTWRGLGWGLVAAIVFAIAWLWPRIERLPDDFEIAVHYLNQQQPEIALLFFRDATWRGVAAYRAGRHAQASREFMVHETVLSLYNLGNSYAHLRDWPNAIATYQRVLRFDPDHADARHNLALVQKAMEPGGRPVTPEDAPDDPPPQSDSMQMTIPQQSNSEEVQTGEGEQSETAGNTSDTDQVGDTKTEREPRRVETVGEAGSAAAIGLPSEERGRDPRQIGGVVDMRPRMSTRPAEVLVRKIQDDPEKVLRARMLSVYETRIAVK